MRIATLLFLLSIPCFAGGPVYTHGSPANEEFRIVYNEKADKSSVPFIFSGSGAPSVVAKKIGDIYVDTSNSKVYVSSAASATAWMAVN